MPAPTEFTPEWAQYVHAGLTSLGIPEFNPVVDPPPPPPPPPPVGLVIPPSLTQTIPGFKANESFRFETSNKDTASKWFDADYIAHGMPYLYPEAIPGNHDHAWWVAGDREGYAIAYGFMYDKHPAPFGMNVIRQPGEGKFIARVTFARPPDAAYAKVNDRYMAEGQRFYDGTLTGQTGGEISEEYALEVALGDTSYEEDDTPGDTDIRIGLFRADGAIADIRDWSHLTIHSPDIKFKVQPMSISPDGLVRASVVMFEGNLPGMGSYYDVTNGGRVVVEYTDGVTGEPVRLG